MTDQARRLAGRYGSITGYAQTLLHRALFHAGRYRSYQHVDWGVVSRVVFVCKGNICRSAYAHAVAEAKGKNVISCGINAVDDGPADQEAIRMAEQSGFDLKQHRTKSLQGVVLVDTDLVVAMEPWQADFVSRHPSGRYQCTLLGLWGKPVLPHIQDPYGLQTEYFKRCFRYIEDTVNEISRKLEEKQEI